MQGLSQFLTYEILLNINIKVIISYRIVIGSLVLCSAEPLLVKNYIALFYSLITSK